MLGKIQVLSNPKNGSKENEQPRYNQKLDLRIEEDIKWKPKLQEEMQKPEVI